MTPDSLRDLFIAAAGVAGALIGLLFVAISVEHERLTAADASQVHRVRASAALTAFSNALTVSLFSLVPGALGKTTLIVSIVGLAFVAGSVLSLWRARRVQRVAARDTVFVFGLAVAFGFQLMYGLRLAVHASDPGAADGIAVLVIVCFLLGIARSWELIGGPSIGLGHEVTAIVRGRVHHEDASADGGDPPAQSALAPAPATTPAPPAPAPAATPASD